MNEIPFFKKVNIFSIGLISSLLLLLMFYTMFAQLLVDFVIGELESNTVLFAIIIGLLLITSLVSITVGSLMIEDVKETVVIKASIMSLLLTFFVVFIVSYVSLIVLYPEIFLNVEGFEVILIFPQVIVYFGIYVLDQVYYLFILFSIIYFIFFVIFIELFFEPMLRKYEPNTKYRW